MRVTIIGLGLIGCSLALAMRKKFKRIHLVGIDANKKNSRIALKKGYIDELAKAAEAIPISDIVILAVPVSSIEKILPKILDIIHSKAVVLDMGSTKKGICDTVRRHPKRKNFIACHPMAGTENSGPEAAIEDLFTHKVMVVCEPKLSSPLILERALKLFSKLQMRVVFMEPSKHDVQAAYISHLSHVVSYALAITVLQKEKSTRTIFNLAGSGFQTTVRLAKSHPEMWTPIITENAQNIHEVLNEYMKNLAVFKRAIQRHDQKKISTLIKRANRIRKVLQ